MVDLPPGKVAHLFLWDTIAFYQKCGFRMDHVRHNFFSYIQPPLVIDAIPLVDMRVLRYLVAEAEIR
jgi:hypothetical protein